MVKSIILIYCAIVFWLLTIHKDEMARRLVKSLHVIFLLLITIFPVYFAIALLMMLMPKIEHDGVRNLIALGISIPLSLSGLLIFWSGGIKGIISNTKNSGIWDTWTTIINTFHHNWCEPPIWEIDFTNEFLMWADKPIQWDSPQNLVNQLETKLCSLAKCYGETYARRNKCHWYLWIAIILIGLLDILSLSLCVIIIEYSGLDLPYVDDYPWLWKLIICLILGVIFLFFSNQFVKNYRQKIFQKITSIVGQLSATGNFVLLVTNCLSNSVDFFVTPDRHWIDNKLLNEAKNQDNYFILRKGDEFWSYAVPTFIDFKRFDSAFKNLRNPWYVNNYLRRIRAEGINKVG